MYHKNRADLMHVRASCKINVCLIPTHSSELTMQSNGRIYIRVQYTLDTKSEIQAAISSPPDGGDPTKCIVCKSLKTRPRACAKLVEVEKEIVVSINIILYHIVLILTISCAKN